MPDGTTVLGVHAAPGRDDGLGFRPGMSDAALARSLGGCDVDLVLAGHHHQPLDVTVRGVRVVNVGSVSNPLPPDLRASYALLVADRSHVHVQLRRVAYDRQAVAEAVQRIRHPGAAFIVQHMRGLRKPPT